MEFYSEDERESSGEEYIEYIPASRAREFGAFELSEEVRGLFPDSPVDAILTKISLRGIKERNPEPIGGLLKSQALDSEVAARMGVKERKEDERLSDLQRAVLQGIRPLVNILERITAISNKEEADTESLPREFNKIARAAADATRYYLHVAGTIRLERQKQSAKAANLPEKSISINKAGKDDTLLFGKDFIEEIRAIEDAKVRNVLLSKQNDRP